MSNVIVNTPFILPQAVISNGETTGNPWSNPDYLLLVDELLSEANSNAGSASDVIIGNFNINLPQDAVVTGIEMQLIAKAGSPTSPPLELEINAIDNTSGTDVPYPYISPISLTQTLDTYTLGTPNYQFASQFTPDQINNLKLQLVANGDIYVDSLLLKVYYYTPATITPIVTASSGCLYCNSPIQVQAMSLAQDFLAGQTKFYLKKGCWQYPDGTPVQPGDVGICDGLPEGDLDFVFDPGKSKQPGQNFEENAVVVVNSMSWTVQSNGDIEVDIGDVTNRGIQFHTPWEHVPTLMSDHSANSRVLLSNNARYESRFVRNCQADAVFSVPIYVLDENGLLSDSMHFLDVEGGGGSIENDITDPHKKILRIPGAGGTTPPQVRDVTKYTSFNVQVDHGEALLNVSGLNRGAVVNVLTEEAATITNVQVGGVACTQISSTTDAGTNQRNEMWFCVNPPLGAELVEVDLDIPAYLTFGAEALAQVDTTDMIGTVATPTTGTSFNPFLNITTDRDNSIIIDSLGTAQTPILYTVGAGQALNWEYRDNNVTRQGASSVEPAGLQPDIVTMDYSITQNTLWTMCAIEIHGITTAPVAGVTSIIPGANVTITSTGPSGTGDVTVNSSGGGGGSGELIEKTFTQAAHGFVLGNVLGSNNSASQFKKVISNFVDNNPIGFATLIPTANSFKITYSGMALIPVALLVSFANGDIIYLSTTVAGGIQQTTPLSTEVTQVLGVVIDKTTGLIDICIQDAFTGGSSTSPAYNNIYELDDFTDSFASGSTFISGNFAGDIQDLLSETDHPGFVRLVGNSAIGGFLDSAGVPTIPLGNDFQITFENRSVRPSGTFEQYFGLDAGGGVVFQLEFVGTLSSTLIYKNINGVDTATAVNIPITNTWYRAVFSWVASTGKLTITVDGVSVYNSTWAIGGQTTVGPVASTTTAGGAGTYQDVDFVITNYQVTR